MTTMTAIQAHEAVETFGATAAKQDARDCSALKVGECARQGDIYVAPLAALPKGLTPITLAALGERGQLALGTTDGSRHIAVGNGLSLYRRNNATALDGPVIEALEPFTVTHPEHAHMTFAAGLYDVTYQRDCEQEELAAVRD
jgi:hypothetical protein